MKKLTILIIMISPILLTGCDYIKSDELESLKIEISSIEEYEDTNLLTEIDLLSSKLTSANNAINDIKLILDSTKNEVSSLQDDLSISNSIIASLETKLNNSVQTIDNLENEIDGIISMDDFATQILNTVSIIENSLIGIVMKDSSESYSSGSGVIYRANDNVYYVITNYHVIDESGKPFARLKDNSEVEMNLLGFDYYSDLAVLTFTSSILYEPITFATYEDIDKGDTAIAIGTPISFDHYNTVTFGLISNIGIYIDNNHYYGELYIQTDASLNPGSSGGGLFNINGELIGINVMKSVAEDVEGMAYSIPINLVETVVSVIETGDYYKRPDLGYEELIDISTIRNNRQLYKDISIPSNIINGVYLKTVTENGVFNFAEIIDGDIITHVNGKPVNSIYILQNELLYNNYIDSIITFSIIRSGVEMNLLYNPIQYSLKYYTYGITECEDYYYIGEIYNSMKNGNGSLYYDSGDYFIGTFSDNDKLGLGTYYWEDGVYFYANWLNSSNTEDGIFHYTDGSTKNFNLVNGDFIEY